MVNSQFLAFGVNVAAMVALVAVYEYTLDWRNRKSLWTLIRPSKVRTRIAVLLSGCGVYDGSEIQEAVSCLIHLDSSNAIVEVFAPDMKLYHVVDHTTGKDVKVHERNVLVEAGRIARGSVKKLSTLKVKDFDALIAPGGFGVAKNLSNFNEKGAEMKVHKEVERVIVEFHKLKKPMGFCCIAPILPAKVLPGCEITVGRSSGDKWPYGDTVAALIQMNANVVEVNHDEFHVDLENKIVSAPAYMYDSTPFAVHKNIATMIHKVLDMC